MTKVPLQDPVDQVVKDLCCKQGQTSHFDSLPKNGMLLDLEKALIQEEGHQNCTLMKEALENLFGNLLSQLNFQDTKKERNESITNYMPGGLRDANQPSYQILQPYEFIKYN